MVLKHGVEYGVLMVIKTWGEIWGANDLKTWGEIWGATIAVNNPKKNTPRILSKSFIYPPL